MSFKTANVEVWVGGADIEAGGEKIARVFTTDPVSP